MRAQGRTWGSQGVGLFEIFDEHLIRGARVLPRMLLKNLRWARKLHAHCCHRHAALVRCSIHRRSVL